ncbi:MAG: hypothetical protein LC122_12715 [Chitinophagales bacterium]|nr:hypothetical protein [Chitinophagales bacterium]
MAFKEEYDEIDDGKKKGTFATPSNIKSKPKLKSFEDKVKDAEETKNLYKKEASLLSLKYKKMLEDKTLVQNKNQLNLEIESDVLRQLVDLGTRINNDQNEQEGMGSMTLIILLLKCNLLLRDKINDLEYKLSLIQKNGK